MDHTLDRAATAVVLTLLAVVIAALAMALRRTRERLALANNEVAELLAAKRRSDERSTEHEPRWRRLVETLPQLIWTATAEGRADYFGPQATELTGLPQSRLVGWGWLEAVHPDDRAAAKETWARSVTEGGEYQAEHRIRRSDDAYRWFSCRGAPVRDEAGKVVEWVVVSVDVTDRKKLETRLGKSKQQLDLMVRLANASLWEFALSDGLVVNSYVVPDEFWWAGGYKPSSLALLDFRSSLSRVGMFPEDHDRFARAAQACVDGETPEIHVQVRSRRPDGSTTWRLVLGIVSREPDGKPARFMGTAIDITELKELERDLRHAKERLELALLGSRACAWDFELTNGAVEDSRATFTNLWELLGYEPAEQSPPLAEILAILVHPEDQTPLALSIQSCLDGRGREWEQEFRARHKDGSVRWQLARGVVQRDDTSGRALRFTGSIVDITNRKLAERALRESE